MVSAAISWYGAAKPSFVNNNGIKINKENYCWHLRKELFPAIEKVIKRDDWIFSQDGAPSHRFHLVQDFLNAKFEMLFHPYQRMASILTWCKSTGLFLLGLCSDQSLRRKIWKAVCIRSWTKEKKKSVWNICPNNQVPMRKAIKQFVRRMKVEKEKQGRRIKILFG